MTYNANLQSKNDKIQSLIDIANTLPNVGITPTGTLNITENGIYDVTGYASVEINVAVETPSEDIITFYIEDYDYNAVNGMTWEDWFASDYGDDDWEILNNTISLGGGAFVEYEGVLVKPTDVIIKNGLYSIYYN